MTAFFDELPPDSNHDSGTFAKSAQMNGTGGLEPFDFFQVNLRDEVVVSQLFVLNETEGTERNQGEIRAGVFSDHADFLDAIAAPEQVGGVTIGAVINTGVGFRKWSLARPGREKAEKLFTDSSGEIQASLIGITFSGPPLIDGSGESTKRCIFLKDEAKKRDFEGLFD